MILSFKDDGTRDIFLGLDTRAARKTCPYAVWPAAYGRLTLLNRTDTLHDLREPSGNRLEALKGDRRGQFSLRVNRQYRICFCWTVDGPAKVEITDYH
jgi:proteic killer suppression protein